MATVTHIPEAAQKSLTRDVQETLLGWIREGRYPPGSQLPSVPELVRQLEVSRTVVREALQSVVGMNLVELRAGLGCFVKNVRPELVVNADIIGSLLDIHGLIEVAIARKVIEGGVARLAAVTATDEDFETLEDVLVRIERQERKDQPTFSVTPSFHIAVAGAAHNPVLGKIVSSFNSLMAQAGQIIEDGEYSHVFRGSEYASHLRLYNVLKTRDPEAAQREMEDHITRTIRTLEQIRDSGGA